MAGRLERRVLRTSIAISAVSALSLAASGSASAATTVGQLFAPTAECSNSARLQAHVPSGNSYEVPADGVITSWSFRTSSDPVLGLKLKVGRPGGGTRYTVVGESPGGQLAANAVNTRSTRIPVKKKDYLGVYAASGDCQATTSSQFDIYALYSGDPPVGSTSEDWPYQSHAKIPVQAKVEKDADNDGFGDESQDLCPTTPGSCAPDGSKPPQPPAADSTPPVLGAVGLTKRRFAVGARTGTAFSFTLSEAARVTFRISRKQKGRRVRGKCRRPSRRNRRRKACTRLVDVATFARNARAGRNSAPFSGRLGKKELRPGRYRASLSARDAAGNVSAARTVSFRVVRRK